MAGKENKLISMFCTLEMKEINFEREKWDSQEGGEGQGQENRKKWGINNNSLSQLIY